MKQIIKDALKIFGAVREYKKYAILTPIMMIGEAAMECAIPLVMSKLIDQITSVNIVGIDVIWPYIIALVCMAIVSLLCGIFGGIWAAKASTGLAKNLRHDMYEKIQSFSFANIDHFEQSSLITRMTTDINNASQAFQMCIRIVVRAPLMLIFSAVFAFISGGVLAFIFVALIPLVMFGLGLLMIKAMPVFKRVFKRYDALNQSVQENVSGIRVVKSFVREDYECEKFNNASNSIAKEFIHAEKILAFNNPLLNTAIHLSNILVLSIGSWLILNSMSYNMEGKIIWGNLSPAQMSSCITYGIQILSSLMMISMIIVMLALSLESIKRITEVMNEEPTIKNPENPIMDVPDGSVEFKNVNFKYSEKAERNSVGGINVKIENGQFIGIMGSTGTGKTTLVNLISRLYDATDGEVLVGGHNVKEYDLKALRDSVSVVLQKNVLFSGTIKDNLKWGNINATDEEIIQACKIAHADEFIETFPDKYDTHIEQGGTNVSGGQKQRLCIARAILKNPKILIFDDSTSAVDTRTDALIRKALREDLPNTTKIVIAQRVSSIIDADNIICMDRGEIRAIGTHEWLMENKQTYRDVYNQQNKKGGK